jgi:hypothetical protein
MPFAAAAPARKETMLRKLRISKRHAGAGLTVQETGHESE